MSRKRGKTARFFLAVAALLNPLLVAPAPWPAAAEATAGEADMVLVLFYIPPHGCQRPRCCRPRAGHGGGQVHGLAAHWPNAGTGSLKSGQRTAGAERSKPEKIARKEKQ